MPPTVTDPHVAHDPIDTMSDVDALRTIILYIEGIASHAAQLPQASADVAALFPPLQAPPGGGGPLISPLEEALLPVQETYAQVFPLGDIGIPSVYAQRLGVIVSRLGGAVPSGGGNGSLIPVPKGGLVQQLPGSAPVPGGGDTGGVPTPDGTAPAKPAMTGWAAATGLLIVAAGAGAIWYMHHQRTAPASRAPARAREGKAKALPRASP